MSKVKIRIAFIASCALLGLSLGAGVGFGIAGLNLKISIFVLAIGEILAFVMFAIAATLLLLTAVAFHKRALNQKAVAPYFAKPSRCKELHFIATESRKNRHAKVLVLSYFDPRDAEKGGLLHQASINASIEKYFEGQTLYFSAPNRFVFFAMPEEISNYMGRFEGLAKKLKNKDLSLRLLIGESASMVEKDFQKAYSEAIAALEDRYHVRENLSKVVYGEEVNASPIAGLRPIELEFVSQVKETITLYPFGYYGHPADLSFLGELGMREDYEAASLELAKAKMAERNGKIGIYFSPASFHASSYYLSLSAFPDKKRLIVFLPASEEEPKLAYAAKKIKRLGCLVGYYGVNGSTVLSRLDLEGSYLYLQESFYDEDISLVKAKKRLFASHNAFTLGVRKEEGYIATTGGEGR